MPNHPFSTSLTTSASAGLADWLRSRNIALAFTTYRANRLLFLGTNAGEPAQLKLHERLFDRPMDHAESSSEETMRALPAGSNAITAEEMALKVRGDF